MNETTALEKILSGFRAQAKTEREKGTYFENLVRKFLSKDKTYSPQFSKVLTYQRWAKGLGLDEADRGVDLVAKNVDDTSYTAIQCKFRDVSTKIPQGEITGFIAASDGPQFNRRLLVDTTSGGLGGNAEKLIETLTAPFHRITLDRLENSSIDWDKYIPTHAMEQKDKKELRPHQIEAIKSIQGGLKTDDRGKLVMACGTGKTLTALKVAEAMAGKNKSVLFLAPSLSLVSQTITEWTIESGIDLHAFAVCSDTQVGKRKVGQDDIAEINIHDLAYPATTDAKKLAAKYKVKAADKMNVVFATYQSIDVISKAQKDYGLGSFDLIVCDEAHRTTGATLSTEDDSSFVKIHSQGFVQGDKRIYMTATPRVYISQVKAAANKNNATLYSMDDEDIFGKELYTLKFGEAVEKGLLSDYKVLVLALDDSIATDIQTRLADSNKQLTLDDVTKMVGCYKALSKAGISDTEGGQPMTKVVAFSRTIKDSKLFKDEFSHVIKEYSKNDSKPSLVCEIEHVDGTMNTSVRNQHIDWLKGEQETRCRILTNVRCLSEGVDVPSLDAVLFVHSRKSKIDIVQSVGRVMRKAAGKNLGYVILPIVVPAGIETSEVLDNNKNYEVVWDVLNALRSHDERLDADINQAEFNGTPKKMEIISEVAVLHGKPAKATVDMGGGDIDKKPVVAPKQGKIDFEYDSVQKAILAKIVEKCGTRTYWENWASDIAKIADQHIKRIGIIIQEKNTENHKAFKTFLKDLQKNVNAGITEGEAIEMLAQHSITQPVFDALFSNYDFAANNSVSKSIQKVLDILDKGSLGNEAKTLDKFYDSIKRRVAGIETAEGKQKIVIELYDKFFKSAFPKIAERLGIVYTPVECVDFIIKSVNDVLQQEFGQSLGHKDTHIIDPFTGTGTFIARLIQSELISKEELAYKYSNELHANEIVLLAYYIAAINIETSYYDAINKGNTKEQIAYQPFNGICLTDSFQLHENKEDLITPQLPINSARLNKQKKLDIKVIIGNPPYSIGQRSSNDNNQNMGYPKLDKSIESSYVKHSTTGLSKSVYDSYIRAIRWASNRVGEAGVIGFITSAGWLDSNASDGMRKCLAEEFSDIYVFHLRGDARTSGETRQKEAGNIFGGGSRTPIAISILVKNPESSSKGNINFCDIGDYKTREEKLKIVNNFGSITGINDQNKWQKITPDKHNDWLNLRDDSLYNYIVIGDKKDKKKVTVFVNYSMGLATNRDAWVYNASKVKLANNVNSMIDFYNAELQRYQTTSVTNPNIKVNDFVDNDKTKIAWTVNLKNDFKNSKASEFNPTNIVKSLYRPFTKQNCYFNRQWNERVLQMPQIFPAGADNLVIGVSGKGANSFSVLISDVLPDLNVLPAGSQCFPLKLYETIKEHDKKLGDTFAGGKGETITMDNGDSYKVTDGISDTSLRHFSDYYQDSSMSKEEVFYYIYGLLHSQDYKKRFANNLVKGLPHIPRVKEISDFKALASAGRDLADLHLNYETKEPYAVNYEQDNLVIENMTDQDFYVEKIRFKTKGDKSSIVYNQNITITDIPLEAYEYVVNGKSAIEWVMERQSIRTHKDSQIINNPNDWAIETMSNQRYPLDLLLKVITISMASIDIIKSLPKIDFKSLN